MTTDLVVPQGIDGIDLRLDSARVEAGASFNDWEAAIEALLEFESRAQFWLGDLWLQRSLFARDYHDGVQRLAVRHATLMEYARVARTFPPRSSGEPYPRLQGLSFGHHRVAAAIVDPEERVGWLEDAEMHGWSVRRLEDEIQTADGKVRAAPVSAISYRAVGDLYELATRAAGARGIEPRAWVEEAIREKAARELGLGAAA